MNCRIYINRKQHKNDGFQVTIQLLVVTTRELFMTAQLNI